MSASRSARKPRIVIAGAGIAGSLIASGLRDRSDCELVCLERVGPDEQGEAGTGLNIGPNAIKALRAHLPREAETIVANSLPWTVWTVALTDGRTLMDLRLSAVADNPGIRIRWAELYALLRAPLAGHITYGAELTDCSQDENGTAVTWTDRDSGAAHRLTDIDLLVAGDGRYSAIRRFVLGGPEVPAFLNVCLYRVLFPAGPDCPLDDYGQWFNGPNRLLAYTVPGGFVYCAGSFPIPAGGGIPEDMKRPDALRQAYLPAVGEPSREAAYLIDALGRHADRIHWARLQEGSVTYGNKPGILLAGDAAHPMVPTLGQGATQACEDACVAVDEIRMALDRGEPLASIPARVEARQAERARFVVDLSRRATDTMLAGADPVAGTAWKTGPAFRAELSRLYRDVSMPRYAQPRPPMQRIA
ncbi:MAG: FAD-dependent monooxygenase [Actinomycetospora chiangmaiensis]|nr:FAD-dependent monooxygenase [Actinomycetospora chiangmaiensis]